MITKSVIPQQICLPLSNSCFYYCVKTDGYPECAVETVGEYSNITCWVKYFGDWAPTIEWIGQNSTSIGSYETYTSDKIVGATLMISRNTHSSYKFFMKFNEQGKKTRTIATNVPDYEWISPIFGLIYNFHLFKYHNILRTDLNV